MPIVRLQNVIPWLLLWPLTAPAADLGPELLNAAKKGQTDRVRDLLEKGAGAESHDKNGRTALMLASQHGHPETVSLLLEKGAKAGVRDEDGWNAYGLALLSTSKERDAVLKLLPQPERVRLGIEATWIAGSAFSSCFMTPRQLAERMREVRPDELVVAALREVAAGADTRFIELASRDVNVVLTLQVRPEASCVQQQASDNLRMEIDARVAHQGNASAIWEKTFGGGLKGLKARVATNSVQYAALYGEWAKAEAGAIYWGMVTSLLKDER